MPSPADLALRKSNSTQHMGGTAMAQTGTYITASEHRPTEYQAGYMAAVLGEAFISNPHRRGTEQRKAWALGWVEASHA